MLYSHVLTGFSRRTRQSLQKYEKSESHMLVCTDCPLPHLVRNSRSLEHCAQKCKKVKKNFNCRWVAPFLLSCLWSQVCLISLSFLCSRIETRSIYIFLLFIIGSSLNCFPCAPAGLLTFKGTTGNATCFPLTASPTVWRRRPTSTLLCTKKKVSAVTFWRRLLPDFELVLCFCVFLTRTFRCREGFTPKLPAGDCRLSLLMSAPRF